MSPATVSTAPANFSGLAGTVTSSRVSFSIGRLLSAASATSRAVNFRPIMPAAPVMKMCMGPPFLDCYPRAPRSGEPGINIHERLPLWFSGFLASLVPERRVLQGHPAIHQMRLAGDVAGFIAGEKSGERSNLLRRAKPAHRLPIDK